MKSIHWLLLIGVSLPAIAKPKRWVTRPIPVEQAMRGKVNADFLDLATWSQVMDSDCATYAGRPLGAMNNRISLLLYRNHARYQGPRVGLNLCVLTTSAAEHDQIARAMQEFRLNLRGGRILGNGRFNVRENFGELCLIFPVSNQPWWPDYRWGIKLVEDILDDLNVDGCSATLKTRRWPEAGEFLVELRRLIRDGERP